MARAQRVNVLRRRGGTNRAGHAIVGSSRWQNLDRDAPAKFAAPVAVPSEKEACCATIAVDMHMDGFRRDRDNLAEVAVWVNVIIGQGNALTYSKWVFGHIGRHRRKLLLPASGASAPITTCTTVRDYAGANWVRTRGQMMKRLMAASIRPRDITHRETSAVRCERAHYRT